MEGKIPSKLLETKNPLKTLNDLLYKGEIRTIEGFKQIVTRAANVGSTEPYAREWWPDVQTSMQFV
jgi:hypothetical protein